MTTLTDREVDVLRYSAQGMSATEIGTVMFLAPDTVKGHRKHILKKLDARCITHAVALAIGAGVITADGGRGHG